ncbi:hypothetical protein QNI19_35330 [Cytophagaceae bacterium DM2B3-1]|uniref:DUF3408 domain-containing protein n=1 Tax=Xanthocytophaga flava TaxID=3048013 RepID=A0ABT7CZD1_9BACT|nr:hypothetical protein [Xanthocytophaga flavus]MDJ1498262.1 hypothetical protein [Xanthocytophaga flavus]
MPKKQNISNQTDQSLTPIEKVLAIQDNKEDKNHSVGDQHQIDTVRLTVELDADLDYFIKQIAWFDRKFEKEVINHIVREYKRIHGSKYEHIQLTNYQPKRGAARGTRKKKED